MRRLWIMMLLAGCAGGGASGGSTVPSNAARTASGDTIRTSEGEAVSKRAHSRWKDAMAEFNAAEKSGWKGGECGSVSSAFESAARAQTGDFGEALYMAGLAQARCGNDSKAEEFYEQALKANDKICGARVGLGLRDLRNGRSGDARDAFERAIKDQPKSCASGYMNLAMLQRQSHNEKEVSEALQNLRRALAIDSDYLPAFNQMALLHYERGIRLKKTSEFDLAEVVCRQAQLINADYAPIYNTWGLVKIRKGDVIEALRFFERAIQLDPNLFEAQMNFGQITISFRGYEDGRRSFEQAVKLKPDDYDAAIGLGTALRGLEQYNDAQAQFERAKSIDGRRAEAYFNLGILYQDYMSGSIDDLNRARGYFEEFLQRADRSDGHSQAINAVKNRCKIDKKRGRVVGKCRPGRLQNIDMSIEALRRAG